MREERRRGIVDEVSERIARWWLRESTRVGARPYLRGRPRVANYGELVIGDQFKLESTPVRSHIFVAAGAKAHFADNVQVGAGAAISCYGRLEVEDGVAMGAFVMILDSDFHLAEDRNTMSEARPVTIGRGARLGHRVIVLPGATIGRNAVVRAGSVVSGEIAPDAVVSGNPARAHLPVEVGRVDPSTSPERAVSEIVMHVLGLPSLPDLNCGPAQIPQWDSLGTLRLVLALEEKFVITLSERELRSVRSISELVLRVEAAQARKAHLVAAE